MLLPLHRPAARDGSRRAAAALVTALARALGDVRPAGPLAAPGIALAFWTFAPRYVSSKVVPLAFVADGLYGFALRWNLRNFYPGPHARLSFYPQFLLLEAWVFLAVGLWLTWRATDPNSAAARVILREKGQLPGRRGRPRWGLLLLPVLVLVVELLGQTYWLGIPWWGAVPTSRGGRRSSTSRDPRTQDGRQPGPRRPDLVRPVWRRAGRVLAAHLPLPRPIPRRALRRDLCEQPRHRRSRPGSKAWRSPGFGLWLVPRAIDDRTRALLRSASRRRPDRAG